MVGGPGDIHRTRVRLRETESIAVASSGNSAGRLAVDQKVAGVYSQDQLTEIHCNLAQARNERSCRWALRHDEGRRLVDKVVNPGVSGGDRLEDIACIRFVANAVTLGPGNIHRAIQWLRETEQ